MILFIRHLFIIILVSRIAFAEVVINQCFVCFKPELPGEERMKIIHKYKLKKIKDFILTRASLYESNSSLPIGEIISLLRREEAVLFADYNHIQDTQKIDTNEPRLAEQWYLENKGNPVNFWQ